MSSSAYLNSKKTKLPKYAVDSATGDLTRQGDIPTPGEPGVQGTSPDRKILYAAMRSTGALCRFCIDPHSGRLDLLHVLDTGLTDPSYMATDRTGRYLITPYCESACVTVYAIDDDGVAREPYILITLSLLTSSAAPGAVGWWC